MDKQSLLELLAGNQLEELFDALKNKQGYYKDLILLESQWNDLREKQRNDLISNEEANLELGQIRNSLIQLIELSDTVPAPENVATPTAAGPKRGWMYVIAALAGLFILFEIYRFATAPGAGETATAEKTLDVTSPGRAAGATTLNVSQIQPLTLAAGDTYYERVYSLVKTSVEPTGGGKSLITLTVGLNFKGKINEVLSSDKFRLMADELPGPLAPANSLVVFVDAKSYVEGDVKFELSDQIRHFIIEIEGKEDKRWHFSR